MSDDKMAEILRGEPMLVACSPGSVRLWMPLLLVLCLAGCLKKIPYPDDQLANFHQRSANMELIFDTKKGKQVAFYLPPLENPHQPPARLAILYPGINSLALDWLQYLPPATQAQTAYLLIDYPGRGFCEGSMRPEENFLNSEGALAALAEHFGVKRIEAELSLLGHSFGTGAALQFALRQEVRRIVLVAPYNTLTRALARTSRILAFLIPSQIDNLAQIRTLLQRQPAPEISIIHGTLDTTLPVSMGRELVAIDPETIFFAEISAADHVSVLTLAQDQIFARLLGVEN
jgi:pimeloyl-ACP methyl ester carboxylesterase